MENPWLKLADSEPFVLESDRRVIDQFQLDAKESNQLKTYLMPIPFIGNHLAPVVLLNLNPGFHQADDLYQIAEKFQTVSRNCLAHARNDYPFYFLHETLESPNGGPGYDWWAKRTLSQLLKCFSPQVLSQKIFCVEYFPYRSITFRHAGTVLASQHYGFDLVRQATSRKAIIVLMRSKRLWFEAVPELEQYQHLFMVKNPRNPAITRNNLPLGVFDRIVNAIESD